MEKMRITKKKRNLQYKIGEKKIMKLSQVANAVLLLEKEEDERLCMKRRHQKKMWAFINNNSNKSKRIIINIPLNRLNLQIPKMTLIY